MSLERYIIAFYFRRYKMKDKEKTKKQLIDELTKLRQRIAELEALESKHKRTEEALGESEGLLKAIIESTADGILVVDKENHVTHSNTKFAELWQIPEKLIKLKDDKKLLNYVIDQLEKPEAFLSKVRELYKSSKKDLDTLHFKDGQVFERFSCPLIRNEEIAGRVWSFRDITERNLAEEKIKASLEEKEVMLREIHHRVKNNMQIMSSLLRLQSGKIKDKRILEIFKTSQSRIRSMAFIPESLYQSEDLARIDFSDYTRRVTTHLFSLYGARTAPINYKVEVKDVFLDINTAIPCGLIINELVTNSLKHAFPDDRRGEMLVKMRVDKRGKHTLIVKDTGIGFPERLGFRETETLGMQLVTDLVIQIEGSIKLNREGGTTFTIVF